MYAIYMIMVIFLCQNNVCTPYIYMILAIFKHMGWPEACLYTVYDRILCDFPTKNTVYLLSMYGSGQR